MKKKNLKAKIVELQTRNFELQGQIYDFDPPSTKANLFNSYLFESAFAFFNLKNAQTDAEKRKLINKRISETIERYGLIKFEGENLYNITSIYTLVTALVLIENGMVDYYHEKRSKLKYNMDAMGMKDIYGVKIDKSYFSMRARERATTQKEYDNLLSIFSLYEEEKLFFKAIENEISLYINTYGIDKYLGVSLYEITDIKKYREAIEAIQKMQVLKTKHGITAHNGIPVEELSGYELDGILQALPVKQKRKKVAA